MDYQLPNDPAMLMSMINMKLRDNYESLDELCDDLNISREMLQMKLGQAGFEYDERTRRFI